MTSPRCPSSGSPRRAATTRRRGSAIAWSWPTATWGGSTMISIDPLTPPAGEAEAQSVPGSVPDMARAVEPVEHVDPTPVVARRYVRFQAGLARVVEDAVIAEIRLTITVDGQELVQL